jgi:hypothetical protein
VCTALLALYRVRTDFLTDRGISAGRSLSGLRPFLSGRLSRHVGSVSKDGPGTLDDMTTPQSRIQARIRARQESLGLKGETIARRVQEGDLYGTFTHTTYRNLVTDDFSEGGKPRTTLNKQLIIALSEALECPVSDLATEYELSTLRDVPYRRAQWPEFMLEEVKQTNPNSTVPAPAITADRINAYRKQYAYNTHTELARRMRDYGYGVTNRDMQRILGEKPDGKAQQRIITFAFCEAVARVFRGPVNLSEFDARWLIKCTDTCPHCDDRYISY